MASLVAVVALCFRYSICAKHYMLSVSVHSRPCADFVTLNGIHVLDGQNAQELDVSCVPSAFANNL